MIAQKHPSRREILKAGLTAFTASAVSANSLYAAPKKPGEVRVLFLIGDVWHNGIRQETHWRRVLGITGWRLMFAQSSRYVTPEVLKKTDLFLFCRYAGPDSLGWSNEGVIEERPMGAPFMTNAKENAMVENVQRGMGLIPIHC